MIYGIGTDLIEVERVKKAYGICLSCMAATVLTISVIMFLFRKQLLGLYITDNPEAILYGVIRMSYINCFYVLLGIMDISTAALRGLGYSFVPMLITLMGACGLRIAWVYTIFQIPQYHTMACLYQSYPVSWIITFSVEFILFIVICKKKQSSENPLPQRSIV